jgi:hypothetical protein
MAQILRKMGDLDEAIAVGSQALALATDRPWPAISASYARLSVSVVI